jgi:hypothetical protein
MVLGAVGLAAGFIRGPRFWSGYVLDIVGPAWNYILIRGLFSKSQPAMLSRFVNPEAAFVLIATVCFLIEVAQYLELYDATYDPRDFLAYLSLLVPCYIVDRWQSNRRSRHTGIAS